MKKFEYKIITIATTMPFTTRHYEKIAREFEEKLNALGQEGWEMIERKDGFFFFKREL